MIVYLNCIELLRYSDPYTVLLNACHLRFEGILMTLTVLSKIMEIIVKSYSFIVC